jgi:hypothetical protein
MREWANVCDADGRDAPPWADERRYLLWETFKLDTIGMYDSIQCFHTACCIPIVLCLSMDGETSSPAKQKIKMKRHVPPFDELDLVC